MPGRAKCRPWRCISRCRDAVELCRGYPCSIGFVLRREILGVAGHAIFIRPTIHFGGLVEIAVRRRRWGLPFQGRGLPGIVRARRLSVVDAPEQIDDEGNLDRKSV